MRPSTVVWRLVRFSPGYFIGTVVLMIFGFAVIPIPVALATRAFFDAVAEESAGLNVWTAVAVLVGVQIANLFAAPLFRNPWNAMQQKSQVLVARNLLAGILRGYGRRGLPASPGEAISLMRDDPRVMGDALDSLADLIGRAIFAVAAAAVMWRVDPVITGVLFVPILLSSFIAQLLGNRVMTYRAASRAATARLTGFLGDLLGAQLAIKVGGGTDHAVERLRRMGETRRRMSVRDGVFGQMIDAIHFHLVHVATGVVLLMGAGGIRSGTFTVGDFALFVVLLEELMYLPTEIGRLISDLKRIDVSVGRMRRVVPDGPATALVAAAPVYLREPMPDLPPDPPRDRFERLDVDGLTYEHDDDVRGIVDASFVVERGSFTVITGRIGSGKTTLIHTLLGLLPRDAGEILWNGTPVEDPSTFFVPPRTAFTPQVPRLFSESLRDNLVLGRPIDPSAVDAAIHAAVMEPDVAVLERGLDTLIGPRGVKLSGGQVKRAAAARMFVRDAELLVFDDLSSALDAETEAELWRRLFARGRDVTCIVVSHRPVALRRADQVLLIDAGRLTARGTLSELLETSEHMRRFWEKESV